ncbi:MAG TPA: glycosyltransferase family 4 protein [Solirubrobacteraceae bacterium]|nr:glycosyltransferase family 4 protein [Solirubrobacteraceae bacterium]
MRPAGGGSPSIVHVMGWRSQQYGSFERFLVAVARECSARGARTHLVFPEAPAAEAFARDVDATLHRVPLARHPADPRALRGLAGVLRETRATHLHAHFGLDAYLALAVARRAGVERRFTTKHATPGTSRLTLAPARHRWLARQVEVMFAVSDRVRADLVALGVPAEKVVVSYLGVDPEAYRPDDGRRAAARAALGVGEQERMVLSTSHLRPGKGVELLPELAAQLARDPGRTVVVAAGDGPLRPQLEREASALAGRLRLVGVREDVPDLLAAADVFVFPTTGAEGLPLGPIEALASGTPVVATSVSDLAALAARAALIVPPGDVEALVAACRRVLADPALASDVGARGRALVAERLDVAAAARLHVERYLGR